MTTLTIYHGGMTTLDCTLPRHRIYPPIGYYDTVSMKNGAFASIHGNQTVFEDHEIKQVHLSVPESADLIIKVNELGKHLLQQQGARGCSAAVAAMLLLDHHKKFDHDALCETNLADDDFILSSLTKKGLSVIRSSPKSHQDLLSWLISAVNKNGSAILTVDGTFGAHVVIVDGLSEQGGARIREPYHGWDITLETKAFCKYWQPISPIIQIDQT